MSDSLGLSPTNQPFKTPLHGVHDLGDVEFPVQLGETQDAKPCLVVHARKANPEFVALVSTESEPKHPPGDAEVEKANHSILLSIRLPLMIDTLCLKSDDKVAEISYSSGLDSKSERILRFRYCNPGPPCHSRPVKCPEDPGTQKLYSMA